MEPSAATPIPKPTATDRTNSRPSPHRLCPDPTSSPAAPRTPLEPSAAHAGAAGADPLAHQPDHPRPGRAIRSQPIGPRPHHRSSGPGAGPRTTTRPAHPHPSWIIDATLIPAHDQPITAISKNYRHRLNTQIIICAHRRRVLLTGPCRPDNPTDVIVARHTVLPLLAGHVVLGDSAYRGINSITTPRPDRAGRATTTTGHTAASGPASNTSSPDSRTGKYCDNAAAEATPSTTAAKSSPDYRTSRPTPN